MASILITGGTGSFGRAFVHRLLNEDSYERICIYSRGEHTQANMRSVFENLDQGRLRWLIGDVRDLSRLRRAMNGVDVVVHAAALKRIEVGAYNPIEMVRTNVDGAINVIEAAQDCDVDKVVMLSTDKAYQPISPYGQSKALAESLMVAANNTVKSGGPKFSVTRYGNVWASAGSVVPKWADMVAHGQRVVPVTDPDATRFFMTLSQAVDLVQWTIETMQGAEVVIPELPAYRIGDLAIAMNVLMDVRGMPVYEKLHESMEPGKSSDLAPRMTVEDLVEALRMSGYNVHERAA